VADDRRLIEEWLPIAALSEESVRERRSMTALPPTYYLHVWWARRPLVASRAAVLGALLPAGADRDKFMHVLGIHGDPVAGKLRIAKATEDGVRLGAAAYGYSRAFSYTPTPKDLEWVRKNSHVPKATVLDPTAGGGSIPFEATRLGMDTIANDLNPVAALILKATVEFPHKYGNAVLQRYKELGAKFRDRCVERLAQYYPAEPKANWIPDGYLWARTIKCPYCGGVVPLSPNWRLDAKGTGVRLVPQTEGDDRRMGFEIVKKTAQHSEGTVKGGDATCPFPDCGRVIDGDVIKTQAKAKEMGDQLYAVVYKEEVVTGYTQKGKAKTKKNRGYRAPRPEDDLTAGVQQALDEKLSEWQARSIVPTEEIPDGNKTSEPKRYGATHWQDVFAPRQLLGHCTSVEVLHDLIDDLGGTSAASEIDRAAVAYISVALDKMLNYNSRMSVWMSTREVVANTFNRHDFAFCWSYAEMAPTITGLGYDWAFEQTGKSLKELIGLAGGKKEGQGVFAETQSANNAITVTCESGDNLEHVDAGTIDAVVMDPPYYDNVMYAELSDFFYVWLKRTAGLLYPELFTQYLTDKDREAVANVAKFADASAVKGSGGARVRAHRDYRERMQKIFTEVRRVLKPDGIMVLMFTHKATGAWDALAKGLVDAGFIITASWPVNTEAEGSLHIKEKNAAKSTIFLVCRPRPDAGSEITYWEDVQPQVKGKVQAKMKEFQDAGIGGVDLYLSSFGPALEVFSKHWPMKRGRAMQKPEKVRQIKLIEDEEWDPYAVTPEDALMEARAAVKAWRLDQLTTIKRHTMLDPVTEFFVLAWDAFQAPEFPADEALKLARVVGVNFDVQLNGKILELTGSSGSRQVKLLDSVTRHQKGMLNTTGGEPVLDALHNAARLVREQNLNVAREALKQAGILQSDELKKGLQALLTVLPAPGKLGRKAPKALIGSGRDAVALEKLRALLFANEIPQVEGYSGEQLLLLDTATGDEEPGDDEADEGDEG
jgi:adenine-specific DNA methylase